MILAFQFCCVCFSTYIVKHHICFKMAVVFQDAVDCVFVDHKAFVDASYRKSYVNFDKKSPMSSAESLSTASEKLIGATEWQLNSRLFEIRTPFMMKSQFERLTSVESQISPKSRKRKCHFDASDSAEQSEIKERLSSSYSAILALGREAGVFPPAFPALDASSFNNGAAQKAAALVRLLSDRLSSHGTCEIPEDSSQGLKLVSVDSSGTLPTDLTKSLISHDGSQPLVITSGQDRYVLPPRSRFLMSDIGMLHQLVNQGDAYDFIVVDPPWTNKSVKRKKQYYTLGADEILDMPVGRLAAGGALVVVWATNSEAIRSLVKERLFPAWDVEFCAEWHWLKVTKSGETVFGLNWHHKKPYEHLIIGQRRGGDGARLRLPAGRVICSVPSSVHSHKPPLEEIFKEFLKDGGRHLELFARGLLPGWTSVGNEVLLFQHLDLFAEELV